MPKGLDDAHACPETTTTAIADVKAHRSVDWPTLRQASGTFNFCDIGEFVGSTGEVFRQLALIAR